MNFNTSPISLKLKTFNNSLKQLATHHLIYINKNLVPLSFQFIFSAKRMNSLKSNKLKKQIKQINESITSSQLTIILPLFIPVIGKDTINLERDNLNSSRWNDLNQWKSLLTLDTFTIKIHLNILSIFHLLLASRHPKFSQQIPKHIRLLLQVKIIPHPNPINRKLSTIWNAGR